MNTQVYVQITVFDKNSNDNMGRSITADNKEEFNFAYQNQKEYLEKLKNLSGEKCLAIGETGLDYFYIYKDFFWRN